MAHDGKNKKMRRAIAKKRKAAIAAGNLPTEKEVIAAWAKAKALGRTSAWTKHTTEGQFFVRGLLEAKWHSIISTDEMGDWLESLSKKRKEPGDYKRTPEQSANGGLQRFIEVYYPMRLGHQPEETAVRMSFEFENVCSDRKRDLNYVCQCCGGQFAGRLKVMINDLERWREPGMIQVLCTVNYCYQTAQSLRQRQVEMKVKQPQVEEYWFPIADDGEDELTGT